MNDPKLLRTAIRAVHGCDSTHVETTQVTELWEDQLVWTGDVEVFDLIAHPKAEQAFAWSYKADNGKTQSVAVLKVPPIETPPDAVRAAIASGKIQ